MPPGIPTTYKSKHSNLKMEQCYRNIQLLSSDSTPTVSDWMLNFMQSLQIPGNQLGCPEVTNELNSTISTIIPYNSNRKITLTLTPSISQGLKVDRSQAYQFTK